MKGPVSDRQLRELKQFFDGPRSITINYDTYAEAFAYGYFIRNFWKAVFALQAGGAEYRTRVIDLGCGSGSVALGYLAYIDDLLPDGIYTIHVTLLDKSERQLKIAKDLLDHSLPSLRKVRPVVNVIHADLTTWTCDDIADCVFLGHVLTENSDAVGPILLRVTDVLPANGRLYIIERTDDGIWKDIDERIRDLSMPSFSAVTNADAAFRTKFIKVSAPSHLELRELLLKYFGAWRSQSAHVIEGLFDEGACYIEKPFDPPILGLEEIRQYWLQNVLPQRGIDVRVVDVAYSDDGVFAEWSAGFVDKHGRSRRVSGILILKPTSDLKKVMLLREYFRTDADVL